MGHPLRVPPSFFSHLAAHLALFLRSRISLSSTICVSPARPLLSAQAPPQSLITSLCASSLCASSTLRRPSASNPAEHSELKWKYRMQLDLPGSANPNARFDRGTALRPDRRFDSL